ncbi:vivid PAS protein VVD [Coniochaeta ligniaria NRRL 30616]|uniref:Vivid PAS protein VVD n=1 Tax=Coniochaeta ligniaria NRRL 30616 TaxID=1408157 RepID=A0A1J7J5W2_9PEZI|nr:vivid PAS protein VVD [Coniochaeta ligniaria NRRL 30616]
MNTMNTWEEDAFEYGDQTGSVAVAQPAIFHQTLYTGSGIDVLSILLQMYQRPNPQVAIGPVDASCPLILCDLTQPDSPIIYASDAFATLTGYSGYEVLGRNCRFLQAPPGARTMPRQSSADKAAVRQMRHAVSHNQECQVEITNYRKDGSKFLNYLTIIPVRWNSNEFNYSVGLQSMASELP